MIDLHMHSRYSDDGEFTPFQLIEQCAQQGVGIMSITDHNCIRANEEAIPLAKERGITFIPGIEMDCTYKGINCHMLGYGVDYQSPDFYEVEHNLKVQGLDISMEKLEKTRKLGFHITEDDMRSLAKDNYWSEMWTGEMFAEFLLSRPEYADHPLLKPYREGGSRGDNPYANFFWDFYAQGKACYVEICRPRMEDIVDMIHQNHGFAVLAHPCINLKGDWDLLDGIIKSGIDGIEAYSSYHTSEQAADLALAAKKQNLFVTCGSDYHGKIKPSVFLGKHGCPLPETEVIEPFGLVNEGVEG